MSMLVSFVLSFFPRDVLDEILNLIGSVSEGFPSYFYNSICVSCDPGTKHESYCNNSYFLGGIILLYNSLVKLIFHKGK